MSDNGIFLDERAKRRRFRIEGGAAMAAYTVVIFAAWPLLQRDIPRLAAVALALAALTPQVVFAYVYLRHIRRMDELKRMVTLESLSIAFAGTAIFVIGYGFLMSWAGFPPVHPWAIWVLMGVLWILGGAISGRRYR